MFDSRDGAVAKYYRKLDLEMEEIKNRIKEKLAETANER